MALERLAASQTLFSYAIHVVFIIPLGCIITILHRKCALHMASPNASTNDSNSSNTPGNKEIQVQVSSKISTEYCGHQIIANYRTAPPPVFCHKLKKFLRENPPPAGFKVSLKWKEVVAPEILRQRQLRESSSTRNWRSGMGIIMHCHVYTHRCDSSS